MEETDRLTIKDAAPFVLVVLVTLAVIGFIVTASSAHANEITTEAATPASDRVDIDQTTAYDKENAELLPAVYDSGAVTSISDGICSWETDKVSNDIDYVIRVDSHVGSQPAYFRTVIALETSADGKELTILNADTSKLNWSKVGCAVDIGGTKYAMYVATCKDPLAGGGSVGLVSQIAMKPSVGSSEVATLGENYDILVATQAVHVIKGNPVEDLNLAFDEITETSHPWIDAGNSSANPA